ncbi:MAG: membrane dipeptidase [Breznakibacter sp.]
MIEICQTPDIDQPPILIDVKHLSLVSRIEFYRNHVQHPIIASHVAVTGCSYMEKPICKVRKKHEHNVYKVKYKKLKGHLPDTHFKPDSINLYDEDIMEILKSGGLIGLILDERVLGYQKSDHAHKEYISAKEWDRFVSSRELARIKEMEDLEDLEDELDDDDEDMVDKEEDCILKNDLPTCTKTAKLQTRYLLNNLWHIILIGDKMGHGIDPRKHVSLGSDFDGLINPVDNCVNVTQLDDLRMELKTQIFQFTPDIAPDIDLFLDDLFFRNGINFLKKYF